MFVVFFCIPQTAWLGNHFADVSNMVVQVLCLQSRKHSTQTQKHSLQRRKHSLCNQLFFSYIHRPVPLILFYTIRLWLP
jgi:hypothetical protein